jgi:plastocyanin
MNNVGRAIHNIHIYDRQGGTSIAATDPLAVPGGQSGTLRAKIDQPGGYFFQCDFHPVEMTGTLNVQGERAGAEATPRGPAAGAATPAPGSGSGAPASTSIQIEARDNSFDKTELTVPAGQQFTITMTNAGRAVHNVNIYDRQGGRSIAATDPMVITGGQSGTLRTTIERPGEYFFQCDFHPVEMTGKLIVR